jgi:hypothetical protein
VSYKERTIIKFGLVNVMIWVAVGDEDKDRAKGQLDILERIVSGIASGEEVEKFANLLNGPTMDKRLSRHAKPCGCKGK